LPGPALLQATTRQRQPSTLSEGSHRRCPLTWSPPFDTGKDDVRADGKVTDGARRVQITQGNVVMGDQMDFLVGTGRRRQGYRVERTRAPDLADCCTK